MNPRFCEVGYFSLCLFETRSVSLTVRLREFGPDESLSVRLSHRSEWSCFGRDVFDDFAKRVTRAQSNKQPLTHAV